MNENNCFEMDDFDILSYQEEMSKKIQDIEEKRENNVRTSDQTVAEFALNKNERLWLMKMKSEFIDAVIVVENEHYNENVHLDVLLSMSNKIKEALIYRRDINTNVKEFLFDPTTKAEVLKELVYFAYHGKASMNSGNSINIADFAAKYFIMPLLTYCLDYFVKNCTIYNVIKGYELSMKINENIEHSIANNFFKNYIENHFEMILEKVKNDLLRLDFKLIYTLLSSSKINIVNEEIVWYFIRDWVDYRTEVRLVHLEFLIKDVLRFGRLKEEFLKHEIIDSSLFKSMPYKSQNETMKWIDEHFRNKGLFIRDGYGLIYSKESPCYFRPRETKTMLLAAGGWVEGQTTSSIEIYDYQTNLWLACNVRLERKISYFGLEIVGDTIYIFGGSNGREIYKIVEALNLNDSSKKWVSKCSMIESRCYVSSAVLDNELYAIGGFNQRARIRKCERYNPELNSWVEIADLNYARSDASAAVHNGKIYIAGGINDSCIERSVEVYSLQTNIWLLIKQMNTPRTSFSIVAFQNKIWALGGNDGARRSNTVECYDPETDNWTDMQEMPTKRSTFRAMVLRNELYAIGGYNGQSPICNVEKFSPEKNQWIKVKEMRHDRSGLSLICISNEFQMIKL